MKDFNHPLTSREDTLRLLLEHSQFQPRVETIPVRASLGRINASEVTAFNTLPNSPSSQMDGIAIKSANLGAGVAIDLSGPSGAMPGIGDWQEGREYVFSNTGVGIPDGFDTVVPIELVEIDPNGKLIINQKPNPGQNVTPPGSMIRTGEILVPAHVRLGPAQLALLAAGGRQQVDVLARPRVAIIPTGNELVPVGAPPPRGKNLEFNGIMIEAQVVAMGAEPRLYPITPDNPEDMLRVLEDALAWADIVILNGGSSKGSDDRALEVLAKIGQMLVYEVDFGPGKHTTVTMAGDKPIVGTVGPTIGAEYGVEMFVKPLINKYLSIPTVDPERLAVKLLDDIAAPMPFDFYIRLEVQRINGTYVAQAIPPRGAGLARQMNANAVLRVPKTVKGYKAGDMVEVELRQPRAWLKTT